MRTLSDEMRQRISRIEAGAQVGSHTERSWQPIIERIDEIVPQDDICTLLGCPQHRECPSHGPLEQAVLRAIRGFRRRSKNKCTASLPHSPLQPVSLSLSVWFNHAYLLLFDRLLCGRLCRYVIEHGARAIAPPMIEARRFGSASIKPERYP